MRSKSWKVENYKGKHMHMWLIPVLFLLLLSLWNIVDARGMDASKAAQGYSNFFYQIPLLNCVIAPIMIAVIASRLCDMELKGNTMKLLFTLQDRGHFYDIKYLHEMRYMLWFAIGEGALAVILGKILHYTEKMSWKVLLQHVGTLIVVSAVVMTLQHFLSLTFENQIVPLIVGLLGSFVGLFSMFFPAEIAKLFLWSYFGAFIRKGMNWNPDTRVTLFYDVPFPLSTFIGLVIFGILFYLMLRYLFIHKEA